MGVSGDDMDRLNGNDGSMTQSRAPGRPDPMRWLWYAFGGGLGPRYRGWVLNDVTSSTHGVRQVARTMVQTAIVGALVMLVLGFGWITWVSLIGGFLLALTYHVAFFGAFAEHRLFQHGYPWGTAQRVVNEHDRQATLRRYLQTNRIDTNRESAQRHGDDSGRVGRGHHLNMAAQLDQRSPRIGQHRVTAHAERRMTDNRPRAAVQVLDLDRIAVDSEF
jgi:hypothetical protein